MAAVTQQAYSSVASPLKKGQKQKTRQHGPIKPSKVEKLPQKAKKTSPGKTKKKPNSPQKAKAVKEKEKQGVESDEEEADEEIRKLCYGSPWDPTQRQILNVEDLDLDKSYVEEHMEKSAELAKEAKKSDLPERRPRWKHDGQEPLTDMSKLAEMGWDSREPDLDSNDLEGQIERCKERIEDNIMPSIFEDRLKQLEARKTAILELVVSEKSGLSWPALLRIKELQHLETVCMRDDRFRNHLLNVRSILAAYRCQTLEWTGLVTYWVNGTQLCQPRPFNWDEYEAINEAHGRSKNFWVEGMSSPRNNSLLGVYLHVDLQPPFYHHIHIYQIALRYPKRDWWVELDFIYDTGAGSMLLYQDDLAHIAGPYSDDPVNVMFANTANTANGSVDVSNIELEATILDKNGKRMAPWFRFFASVALIDGGGSVPAMSGVHSRLDGGMFRRLFYYMTFPDEKIPLVIADSRHSLVSANTSLGLGGTSRKQRIKNINETLKADDELIAQSNAGPIALPTLTDDEKNALLATKRAWPRAGRGVRD